MRRKEARIDDLKALAEVSGMINSSLDIQEVLRNAMMCVQRCMDAEASSIFEIDPASGELFFRLALGSAASKTADVRLKPGEGVAGWVARTGRPLIIADVSQDPRFSRVVDDATGFKTRSILCVPLIDKGSLKGVVEVLNKRGSSGFDEEDLELLTILANQIAIALENARLYARLQDRCMSTEDRLKSTQERLARSEWLAALGRLSQGVAHEVRNPVMVIGGFARRMQKQFEETSPARKTIEIIIEEAERLESLVAAIDELYTMRQPVFEQLVVQEVLSAVLSQLQPEILARGIKVEWADPHGQTAVLADRALMEQTFRNVVQNAIDAQSDGGSLGLEVFNELGWVTVRVRDSGIGIPADVLPTVFEPFVTSKTRGFGLGLTAVYRIVCEHGGEVKIDSQPGKGTEVTIRLPCGHQ